MSRSPQHCLKTEISHLILSRSYYAKTSRENLFIFIWFLPFPEPFPLWLNLHLLVNRWKEITQLELHKPQTVGDNYLITSSSHWVFQEFSCSAIHTWNTSTEKCLFLVNCSCGYLEVCFICTCSLSDVKTGSSMGFFSEHTNGCSTYYIMLYCPWRLVKKWEVLQGFHS